MTGGERKPDVYGKVITRYGFLVVFGVMSAVFASPTYLRVAGIALALIATVVMVRQVNQIRKRRASETDG